MDMQKVTLVTVVTLLAVVGLSQTEPESPKLAPGQSAKKKTAVAEKTIDKLEAARKQRALDLIKRSYALDEQVKADMRLGLLNTQISVAAQLDEELARAWAHELFDLGAKGQIRNATAAQFMAIHAISLGDPDEALALLGQLDPATLVSSQFEFPMANAVTATPRAIFLGMVKKDGRAAMPKILATANTLGEKGRYPYLGVMSAAVETRDDVVIENTTKLVLARCQQRLDGAENGFDFGDMLTMTSKSWPKELLKAAVPLAVSGIQNYPVNENNKELSMTVTTGDDTATAQGPIEMGMLRIAPLVKQVDPDLLNQLAKTYPIMSHAQSSSSGITTVKLSISPQSSGPPATPDEQKEHATEKLHLLIYDDPDRAATAIAEISDPAMKADALSFAAQHWAMKDPAKASLFASELEKSVAKIEDPRVLFRAACAQLHSDAANKDRSAMLEDLDRTFQLADKVLRKTRDDGKDTGYLIGPLVEATNEATKVDPDLAIAHIESIYLPYEKAQLLTAAASALATPIPPTAPAAKTEQTDKQAK